MSPFHFDALARLMVAGAKRRDFMYGIAVTIGVAGFMGSGTAFDDVAGKKRKRRKHRRKHKNKHKNEPQPPQCSAGQVLCEEQCVEGVCCPGTACEEGNCVCRVAVEEDAFCEANVVILCVVPGNCATSDDCELDERCVLIGDTSSCCVPECGSV